MKYKIELNSLLSNEELKILINAYHNTCKRIYGNDIVDDFLTLTNLNFDNIKNIKILSEYSENYQKAIELLKKLKEKKYSLLTVRDENNVLVAASRIQDINKIECIIPDIAYINLDIKNENIVFREIIKYLVNYYTNLGYIKIYLDIPLKDGSKLFDAINIFDFAEDNNIKGIEKTYKLYKDLNKKGCKNQIIVVNKESGMTSRDVINKLNKILNNKKIGHTGTLDPIASGVLVCLTGKYTKLVDIITCEDKEYIAEIKLGIETDTYDITGEFLKSDKIPKLTKNKIEKVLNGFIGIYEQTVPKYSAVHVNGKRLYEYAYNNEEVELPKREVNIKKITLLEYNNDIIKFKVKVSKGTYIRSLIQDICSKLNTIGTMNSLIRVKQGKFKIEKSYTLNDIENNNYELVSLENVIKLQKVDVDIENLKKIENGNKLKLDYKGYVLFQYNNLDLALYYFENNIGKLIILF